MLPPRVGREGTGSRLGGLSGCVNPSGGDRILAVSDSRRDPFFVELAVRPGPPLAVEPGAVTALETLRGTRAAAADNAGGASPLGRAWLPLMLDAEAIVALPAGRLVVASEGNGHTVPPGLHEYGRDGRFITTLPSPLPAVAGSSPGLPGGVRDNLSFEGLAALAGGRLLASLEGPLLQDGPVSTPERGAWLRLFELVPDGAAWRPGRQVAYRFEPVSAEADLRGGAITAGISDLLALDDRRVLVLERAFLVSLGLPPRSENRIRIVQIDLGTGDDLSGVASLAAASFVPVRGDLVLDLDDIRHRLPPELQRLENFEAMCPGPPLPDGRSSLLLISDDNFNPAQRTAFLLFGMREAHRGVTIR
jgi:hypothetical protein